MVSAIPAGYHSLTPYLTIADAAAAVAYYVDVFSAEVELRIDMPDGLLGHAELRIGDSRLMIASEYPEMDLLGPVARGGSPVRLMLYVADVDATFAAAVAAGANVLRPVKLEFYGDRAGSLRDPFGHLWTIATHVEDVPAEEIQRRAIADCE